MKLNGVTMSERRKNSVEELDELIGAASLSLTGVLEGKRVGVEVMDDLRVKVDGQIRKSTVMTTTAGKGFIVVEPAHLVQIENFIHAKGYKSAQTKTDDTRLYSGSGRHGVRVIQSATSPHIWFMPDFDKGAGPSLRSL
jgi:hypothetical protein